MDSPAAQATHQQLHSAAVALSTAASEQVRHVPIGSMGRVLAWSACMLGVRNCAMGYAST